MWEAQSRRLVLHFAVLCWFLTIKKADRQHIHVIRVLNIEPTFKLRFYEMFPSHKLCICSRFSNTNSNVDLWNVKVVNTTIIDNVVAMEKL